ncbi:hypothetical protein C8N47_1387 [Mangrovibacterium marinum]|uniref:Uncharacterized protein n=1 Tax=Mangrovibacterium marinum TaxID=1639118 RepID=A0A2T5BT66_9BACT|nr:hypothetical protein C8N47_1387 [Mangrovibacterium marinum]
MIILRHNALPFYLFFESSRSMPASATAIYNDYKENDYINVRLQAQHWPLQ